jgi:hypothetical protein
VGSVKFQSQAPQSRWRPHPPRRAAVCPVCPAGPPEAETARRRRKFWAFCAFD